MHVRARVRVSARVHTSSHVADERKIAPPTEWELFLRAVPSEQAALGDNLEFELNFGDNVENVESVIFLGNTLPPRGISPPFHFRGLLRHLGKKQRWLAPRMLICTRACACACAHAHSGTLPRMRTQVASACSWEWCIRPYPRVGPSSKGRHPTVVPVRR